MSKQFEHVTPGEALVARALVKRILAAGYEIAVDDNGAIAQERTADETLILNALASTGEDYLYLYKPGVHPALRAGWVRLVWGNDPDELVCDYSATDEIEVLIAAHTAEIEGTPPSGSGSGSSGGSGSGSHGD